MASSPGGSAVTALPSDMATGLVPMPSTKAAWAGSAGTASAPAAHAARPRRPARRRIACDVMALASEAQRHVHAEGEVGAVGAQADAHREVDRGERRGAHAQPQVEHGRGL